MYKDNILIDSFYNVYEAYGNHLKNRCKLKAISVFVAFDFSFAISSFAISFS